MNHIKAGVIGLGVGQQHVRTIENLSNASVVALCDLDPNKAAAWRPNYRFHSSANDLIHDDDVDLVVVASYDNHHCEQVVQAIENDKHVFAEKPLCLHDHELKKIRTALAHNPTVQLSANHVLRTCPRFEHLKASLQKNELGNIYHIEADYYWGRSNKLSNGWRTDMEFYSIIHGAAIHMIDLVMWLTDSKPVSVSGSGNRISLSQSRLRHNDFAILLFEFENGMTAKISAHGGCMHPHHHRVAVFGSRQTFTNEYDGGHWFFSAAPEEDPLADTKEYPAKTKRCEALASFVDHINSPERTLLIPTSEVLDCMEICLAAEKAVATKKKRIIDYRESET